MNSTGKIAPIARWMAAGIAIVVSLAFPLGYFAISYQYMAGSLETEAEINAGLVSSLISTNPELWRYEEIRLTDMLKRRPRSGHAETRRIYDTGNRLVAESVNEMQSPVLTRSHPLLDSGVSAGRIEISRSLRPLLQHTGFVALIGLSIGLALFAALCMLPLKAVVRAEQALRDRNEELALTEEELRHQVEEYQKSQDELYEANQTLTALFESSPLAIIAVDLAGTVTMWNPAAERVFGWNAKEATGRPYPITSAENDNEFWALREYVLGGKRLDSLELRRKNKDGALIDISLSAAPLYDAKGEISGVMSVCDDITEWKRSEKELRKWSDIFQNTRMGIVFGGYGSENLDLINPAYAEMHGYTVEEITGTPIRDMYAPECRSELPDHFRAVMETGHHIYESVHIRKDGSRFPVMVDAATVRDEEGKALYRIINVQEITKRKQAEEALHRNEERFRSLIENTLDIITIVDATGNIRFQSPSIERVLGYDREELIGRSAFDLVHPDDRGRAVEAFNQAILNPQRTITLEYRFLHKNGSWRILEGIGKRLAGKGEGEGVVVNSRDITERREAEEEIRRLNVELEQRVIERTSQLATANNELESFSYSVSHDLRAPLRHIEGFSRILLEESSDRLDPKGKDYLRRVSVASRRMTQLIEDLLNLSKVTRSELSRRGVDLSRLAQDIANELRQADPERRVSFKIAEGMTGFGDLRLLRVVLDNLLGNAWKYTGKNDEATIEFGVTEMDGIPAWFVRDDGVGFDMEYVDRLFGTFQRLHTVDEFEGTGIGLATVQRIVHRHGGRIWAEGAVDKGATFFFTLG